MYDKSYITSFLSPHVLILCKDCFSLDNLSACLCPGCAKLRVFFCRFQQKLQTAFHRIQLFLFCLICKIGITLTCVENLFSRSTYTAKPAALPASKGSCTASLKLWDIFNSFSLPICCRYLKIISSEGLQVFFLCRFLLAYPCLKKFFEKYLLSIHIIHHLESQMDFSELLLI